MLKLVLVASLGALSSTASAEPPQTNTSSEKVVREGDLRSYELVLQLRSAPECPGSDYIKSKLTLWLGEPLAFEKPLQVHAASRFDGQTWQVTVSVDYGEMHGEREVILETCTEAADFIALSVALAVDPQLVNSEPHEETEAEGHETTPPPTEAVGAAKPEETATEEEPTRFNEMPSDEKLLIGLEANLAFLSASAPLPGVHFGATIGVGAHYRGWLAKLGLGILPPFHYENDQAANEIRLANYFVQASVCRDLLAGALFFGPCVGGQLGLLTAQEVAEADEEAAGGRPLWAALNFGAQVGWSLHEKVGIFVVPVLVVPLTRPNLQLDGPSGVTLYQPGVGFQGEAGIFFRF